MRRSIRAAVKCSALLVWSMGMMIPAAAVQFFGSAKIKYGAWCTRIWARGCLCLLGARVELFGDPPESGGGLVVSNHLGYLDIFVHAAVLPVRFAPKREMKRWPLLGAMTALNNPIWIDRSRRCRADVAAREMSAALAGEIPLLVYPEGTSTGGATLLPFKSTCFAAAAECGCAIQPLLTSYVPPEDGTVLPWFGDASLLPHIWRVMGLKEFCCKVYIMKKIYPGASGRKELALQLHNAMNGQYRRWMDNA